MISTSNAFIFLDILTEIKPNVKGGHWGLYYDTEKDMTEDISSWDEWYKNEVCNVNLSKFNSDYQYFIEKHQSKTVVFPEDWKLLFIESDWGYQ